MTLPERLSSLLVTADRVKTSEKAVRGAEPGIPLTVTFRLVTCARTCTFPVVASIHEGATDAMEANPAEAAVDALMTVRRVPAVVYRETDTAPCTPEAENLT